MVKDLQKRFTVREEAVLSWDVSIARHIPHLRKGDLKNLYAGMFRLQTNKKSV